MTRLFLILLSCVTCSVAFRYSCSSPKSPPPSTAIIGVVSGGIGYCSTCESISSSKRRSCILLEASRSQTQSKPPSGDRGDRGGVPDIECKEKASKIKGKRRENTKSDDRGAENKKRNITSNTRTSQQERLHSSSSSKGETDSTGSSKKRVPYSGKTITTATVALLQQTATVLVHALARTDAAGALLAPLVKWSISKRRVAEAVRVEAQQRPATATENPTGKEQRQHFSYNAWRPLPPLPQSLLEMPQPLNDTYNVLASAAALPGLVAEGAGRTAEQLASAPGKVKILAEEAMATRTAVVEMLVSVPRRAREAMLFANEIPSRGEQVMADGVKNYNFFRTATDALPGKTQRLVGAGKMELAKAVGAVEAFSSSFPDLIETAAEDAELLASGLVERTVAAVGTTGQMLWGAAFDFGTSSAGYLLRQTLTPVHDYWTSAKRVQAAVEEEQAALDPAVPPSVDDEAVSQYIAGLASVEDTENPAATAFQPHQPKEVEALIAPGEDISEGEPGKSTVSPRRLGLRRVFSAWRRRRISKAAADVTDECTGERKNTVNSLDSNNTILDPTTTAPDMFFLKKISVKEKVSRALGRMGGVKERLNLAVKEMGIGEAELRDTRTSFGSLEDGESGNAGNVSVATAVADGIVESASQRTASLALPEPLAVASAGEMMPKKLSKHRPCPPALEDTPVPVAFRPESTFGTTDKPYIKRQEHLIFSLAKNDTLGDAVLSRDARGEEDRSVDRPVRTASSVCETLPTFNENLIVGDGRQHKTKYIGSGGSRSTKPEAEATELVASTNTAVAAVEQRVVVAAKERNPGSEVALAPTGASLSTTPSLNNTFPDSFNPIPSNEKVSAAMKSKTVAAELAVTRSVVKNESLVSAVSITGKNVSIGDIDDFSGGWGVMSPATEFLKEWVNSAVPKKKFELRRKQEEVVCWEQQWYPVAIVSELPQWQPGDKAVVGFKMLGRDYELLPDGKSAAWSCRTSNPAQGLPENALESVSRLPVLESSGLLWVWPDNTPEGLATAVLANPAPLPSFSQNSRTANKQKSSEETRPWRRLLRRRPHADRSARGGTAPGSSGSKDGHGKQNSNRSYEEVIEREIVCGYEDAVNGLLSASHGVAVRLAAAGRNDKEAGTVVAELDTAVDASLTSAGKPGFKVTFSTSFGGGEVSYTSPMVVEWRFSPPTQVNQGAVLNEAPNRKRPNFDRPPVPNSSPGLPLTRETKHTLSQRLRRRLEKFRGKKEWKIGGAWREIRRGILGRHQPGTSDRMNGRGVSYVVVLLPVGPGRTKVFARLGIEPFGPLDVFSLWWSQRVRRALLARAIDDVASTIKKKT